MNEPLATHADPTPRAGAQSATLATASVMPTAPVASDGDVDGPARALPDGHPVWQRDGLAVSSRIRALLATLHVVVVRALGFWDHVTRTVRVGGRTVEIDPSGCYRLR